MGGYRMTDAQARAEVLSLSERSGWKFNPTTPYPGTSLPWIGLCGTCGRQINPRLDNLRLGRGCCNGCKYDNQEICKRQDKLEARTEAIGYGFIPSEDFPGATKAWKGSCARCGILRQVYMTHLRRGISACPSCREDFDGAWDDADIFYVVKNPSTGAVKFGITRKDVRPRLSRHKTIGYTHPLKILVMTAPRPVTLEKQILLYLKQQKATSVHGREFFGSEWESTILEMVDDFNDLCSRDV